MLLFEQAHYEATGTYVLSTPNGDQAFCFENVLDAKAFVDYYYRNPIGAIFAYEALRQKRLVA